MQTLYDCITTIVWSYIGQTEQKLYDNIFQHKEALTDHHCNSQVYLHALNLIIFQISTILKS